MHAFLADGEPAVNGQSTPPAPSSVQSAPAADPVLAEWRKMQRDQAVTDVTSRLIKKYFDIADQVVTGQIGDDRAHAAIRALNSVVQIIKVVSP